ncbi:head-tail connector protein [Altererythrobacter fulvus]|uniref:head-tail connector protein n=1 Tax=Caenibius fulvus TaxID=2126012 RepID=UPI00301ACDF0
MRTILTPAPLPEAALGELKAWLAITSAAEDQLLAALLRAALDAFEGLTGRIALAAECEELLPARPLCWLRLSADPVQAITAVAALAPDGTRTPLPADAYAVELEADGSARFRLLRQGTAKRIAFALTAGLASDWPALPEAIRHGAIRLAAHLYRERDGEAAQASPPAAVAALWRPWRRVRLV